MLDRPRILVVRRGALGDTLLLLPLLHTLRAAFPGHALWLAAAGEAAGLVRDFGIVDRALSVEDLRLWRHDAGERARAELCAELQDFRQVFADVPLALPNARLLTLPRDRDSRPAAVQIQAPVAAELGSSGPVPLATLCAERAAPAHPPEAVLHPGSGSAAKCWPAARFAELARRLQAAGLRVVMSSGEAELGRGDDLGAVRAAVAETLEGQPLLALARRIARARCFVGNDSGVTHLAAALRVPTVALFGPTDPAVWAPALPWVTVVGHRAAARPDATVAEVLQRARFLGIATAAAPAAHPWPD